jgi:hypothetical protein
MNGCLFKISLALAPQTDLYFFSIGSEAIRESLKGKTMIKKILKRVWPGHILATLENYKILSSSFGQYKTSKLWACVDANNLPIPWYTYPAIEYIKQLDFSNKTIFEYGSGNSTRFWAARCRNLVSVEDNREWYDKIKSKTPDNVEYLLLEESQKYVRAICKYPYEFDVVIIDGNHRYECAVEALGKLRDDGFIILDNSDCTEKTSQLLRESDLIEVDMSGFGPINGYTWTTSFYFKRNVRLMPAYDRQPVHGIGSLKLNEA